MGDIIKLNVGGTRLYCKRSTLLQYPDSYLGSLFSGRWDSQHQFDSDGNIYLELNGQCFEALVEYLRDQCLPSAGVSSPLVAPASQKERMWKMLQYLQLEEFFPFEPMSFSYT